MASASSTLTASTSNRNFWELWNRYNSSYYEDPVLPDPGIRFKFDLASPASGLGVEYSNLNVSNDPLALFKGAYLVTSMAAFGLPNGANLQNKTLSVKVNLKIDGANPVFLYPADEGLAGEENTCPTPARVSLYFESLTAENGYWYLDTLYANYGHESLAAIFAKKGTVTLQASFNPINWKDSNAISATSIPDDFNEALSSASNVGITIGGGCFAATGVALQTGTAKGGRFDVIEIALKD